MALRFCLKIYFRRWMMLVFLILFIMSAVMIHTLPWVWLESHRLTQRGLHAVVQEKAWPGDTPPSPAHTVCPSNHLEARKHGEVEQPTGSSHTELERCHQGEAGEPTQHREEKHIIQTASEKNRPHRDTGTPATEKATGKSSGSREQQPQRTAGDVRSRQESERASSSGTFISNQPLLALQRPRGAGKPASTFTEWKAPVRRGPVKIACTPHGQRSDVRAGKVITHRQSATKTVPRELRKKSQQSKHTGRKRSNLSAKKADTDQVGLSNENEEASWCKKVTEDSLLEKRNQGLRSRAEALPWLSEDDIQKMELLSGAKVVSKARVPAHGQVLQVGLDRGGSAGQPESHKNHCQQGLCALVKRTEDWFEVFAFHLDRVLSLNRSLPAVSRRFHSDLLPYKYTSGVPRPAVWWDPGIQHLADDNNDQNSFPLSWVQYQALLKARCDDGRAPVNGTPCVGIHHSEWGRLALFDFLLQVNDRLDRYCCGFVPDPSETCVDNLLHAKCTNPKDLLLVHILVRKADPSRLVFIDNAGRPYQSHDNLNFLLVEGIDEFPERAVSVLKSGCLEAMLLRSLYTDQEFWDSQGGLHGLRPLIHTVERRAKILLRHIRDQKLRINRDL